MLLPRSRSTTAVAVVLLDEEAARREDTLAQQLAAYALAAGTVRGHAPEPLWESTLQPPMGTRLPQPSGRVIPHDGNSHVLLQFGGDPNHPGEVATVGQTRWLRVDELAGQPTSPNDLIDQMRQAIDDPREDA